MGLARQARQHRPRPALLQQHPLDLDTGQHLEIGALADGFEKGLGGIPAHAIALIDLEVAAAFVVTGVEVFHRRDAGFASGGAKGIEQRPVQALPLDPPFAPGAVKL